ncbi:bis(5'-nucleosyl)-tetraphosphatase (symmetrical) YqeK [Sporosarcina sp. HYO08]|uniref:bis(5'-nucleosyl)-tetraphosphatase (symmetrical) YqeK n=1 Tax=Sporosarcina sp. HYO08 TaxID=1759557 RepID=UPI000792B315|nr:bis(5'-nucleosyl)-tetraphosphatase (symmetrical) YqeK [Sporosarcina sp. HYO08]KXH87381.1 phosphohydrolase [Sporosarcina sp. HYO08]
MEVDRIKQEIEKRLTNDRYLHVLRVVETAKAFALRHDISVEKAELAALLHDVAKCMSKQELASYLEKDPEAAFYRSFHPELWHAPVGAIIARDKFGVRDADILQAIRFHTTGRAHMSPLEKLIYVADLIEPGRQFPGLDDLRKEAGKSVDAGMRAAICHSIQYLLSKQVQIFPSSIHCYNEHVIRKEQ